MEKMNVELPEIINQGKLYYEYSYGKKFKLENKNRVHSIIKQYEKNGKVKKCAYCSIQHSLGTYYPHCAQDSLEWKTIA